MKREEKNQQMRRRILDSARAEFARQGYGASSVNAICDGVSKGIVYHYFETKDALYLACVEECLTELTVYLEAHAIVPGETVEAGLKRYFTVRMAFFQDHPDIQRLFCEALVNPPTHLKADILRLRAPFDALNVDILRRLLEPMDLRIPLEVVIDTFRRFQDFINAGDHVSGSPETALKVRETRCHQALNILLYGVVARKDS